jgi:hypothetical protein
MAATGQQADTVAVTVGSNRDQIAVDTLKQNLSALTTILETKVDMTQEEITTIQTRIADIINRINNLETVTYETVVITNQVPLEPRVTSGGSSGWTSGDSGGGGGYDGGGGGGGSTTSWGYWSSSGWVSVGK